jgi:hypothetical protein
MISQYHDLYVKELTEVKYNEHDRTLGGENGEFAIVVKLPTVESFYNLPWDEAIKLIDGYGLPPHKQKYDTYRDKGYFNMPPKLEALGSIIRERRKLKETDSQTLYPEDYFDEIESDPVYYKEEIDWIKLQKKRAIQGYWCFINGRPTYIDGWHYTYLNWIRIENQKRPDRLPFYRDVDRRIFLFFKWAYTTRIAYFKYKMTYVKGGKVVDKYFNNKTNILYFARKEKLKESEYELEEGWFEHEKSHRTVFGVVLPKRRRVGATFMGAHVGTRICTDTSMGTFAIQALTEETAKDDVYQGKIMKPWTNYPFFFKPSHGVHTTSQLVFTPRAKVKLSSDILEHGGWIRPRSSANKAFDGNLLYAYLNDESGKKSDSNIYHEFTDTIKNALAQGENIHGFAFYTSTFGEFESGGGKEYFELCKKSISHKRNDNGFTASGLVTLFVPAYDGYDGYVDEFGYSVIDDPETPFRNMEGEIKTEGARSVLENNRQFLEEIKDWGTLNTEIRNNPFTLAEAGSRASKSNFWDINILRGQIAELKFNNTQPTFRVNLEWTEGIPSRVVATEAEDGKFIVSYLPPENSRNQMMYDGMDLTWKPQLAYMDKFVLGCDPFSFNNEDTTGKKKSNGGGAMFYKLDAIGDAMLGYKFSERFVVTYNNRVDTTDEYCEDMAKAAIFYNAMVMTERNVPHIITKFREWNMSGYLLHMVNPVTGKLDDVAGIRTNPDVKERLFSKVGDYVKANGGRERHIELLEEVLEVQDFKDMTDYDLFTAGGMALLGSESNYVDLIKQKGTNLDGDEFFEMYD